MEFTNEEILRFQEISWNIIRHRYYHGMEKVPEKLTKHLMKTHARFSEEVIQAFSHTLHNEAITLHTPFQDTPQTKVQEYAISTKVRYAIAAGYFLMEAYKNGYQICGKIEEKLQRIQNEGDCSKKEAQDFHLYTISRLSAWLEASFSR